jgi:hypothetical protein
MLYKKINIQNYEIIRKELEDFSKNSVNSNLRFWDVRYETFENTCPTFFEFIETFKKVSVRLCRFYLTPAFSTLPPHIDGLTKNRSPLGLNLPILNYKNSLMSWYDSPENNFIDGPYGFNRVTASKVVDLSKIKKIESIIIDMPTFVRTDVIHSVENFNPTPRLVLSIRWFYNKDLGQKFNDIMDLEKF